MKLHSEHNHEIFVFEALDSFMGIGFNSWDKNQLNTQRNNCRNPKWSGDI